MSVYTTQVRFICEQMSGGVVDGKTPIEYVEGARDVIFAFPISLPDEHKERMLNKVLLHFYTREICEETYGLWKLRLQQKLDVISPYYSELIANMERMAGVSPFDDVNYTEQKGGNYTRIKRGDDTTDEVIYNEQKLSGEDNITTEYGKNNSSVNMFNDTPQGGLEGAVGSYTEATNKYGVGNYLTNVTVNQGTDGGKDKETTAYGKGSVQDYDGQKKTTYNTDETDTDTRSTHVFGKRGTKTNAEMLKEYTQQIVNIDGMFVEEFEDCFMQIF